MQEIFVYCEIAENAPREVAFELLGEAARLARLCDARVSAVVVAPEPARFAPALAAAGASRALLVEDPAPAQELRHAAALAALARKYRPDMLLLGATTFGRSLAPRVAARLETGLTADCTRLDINEDGLLVQTRPAFGGNLLASILCPEARPQMATVRPKLFPRPAPGERPCELLHEPMPADERAVTLLDTLAERGGVNLADYDVLVAVGQGIGGAHNLSLAEALAARLHGALAATRPLVDAGLVPYARQVGQTGRTVAPRLYLALGVSGAIQHLAGIASGTIVAVNTDPDAPIFQHARYALVQSCADFLHDALALLPDATP